jgi:hypothetical protein
MKKDTKLQRPKAVRSSALVGPHGAQPEAQMKKVIIPKIVWSTSGRKLRGNELNKFPENPLETKLCQLARRWLLMHQKSHLLLVERGGVTYMAAAE